MTVDSLPITFTCPPGYKETRAPFVPAGLENHQRVFGNKKGLVVMVDCSRKADGNHWFHVSFSYKNKMPSYHDIREVKQVFLGDRKAIMVFPEREYYVNIHSYCLHLWACVGVDPIPEFSQVISSTRVI